MLKRREIRIHSWGGLGSQLFALGTAYQAHQRIPFRRIVLVIHSSGVTFRTLELDFKNEWLRIEFVDDFEDLVQNSKAVPFSMLFKYRKIPLTLLTALGFMNSLNTDLELKRLKPWVTSIRGHYSHKRMDSDSLGFLARILDIAQIGGVHPNAIGVHYRLGDLLTLESKSFISEKSLIKHLKLVRGVYEINQIDVFTDSPGEAKQLLLPIETNLNVISIETLATIKELIGHEVFVGTNSKISIWITLFRLAANPKSIIYLPTKSSEELSRILDNFSSWENLYFFD